MSTTTATLTLLNEEIVVSGSRSRTLKPPLFSFGRSTKNDFFLQNVHLSRVHCCFEYENGSWFVIDKSSNGTVVNNQKIDCNSKLQLKDGDVIKLGLDIKLRYNERPTTIILESGRVRIASSNEMDALAAEIAIAEAAFALTDEEEEQQQQQQQQQQRIKRVKMEECNNGVVMGRQHSISNNINNRESNSSSITNGSSNMPANALPSTSTATDNLEIVENELQCSICTEMFIKAVTLNCSHSFCSYCISEWRKDKRDHCPICRKPISSVYPTRVLDSLISKVLETASEEIRNNRKELIAEREAAAVANTTTSTRTLRSNSRYTNESQYHDLRSAEVNSDDDDDDDQYIDYNYMSLDEILSGHYAGYGRCYCCGAAGHWANTCPYRSNRRRF